MKNKNIIKIVISVLICIAVTVSGSLSIAFPTMFATGSSEKTLESTSETSSEQSEISTESSVESSNPESSENSVENSAESSQEESSEVSNESIVESSQEESSQTSTESSSESSQQESSQTSTESSIETSQQESSEFSVESSIESSQPESSETTVESSIESSQQESSEVSVESSIEESNPLFSLLRLFNKNIQIPSGKMLVLGASGSYLIKDGGEQPPSILPDEWDNPEGLFDSSTVITAEGPEAYLYSTVPATISEIKGTGHLYIIDGSEININSEVSDGINIENLSIGNISSLEQTIVNINSSKIGINFTNKLYIGPNSKVSISGGDYGIFYSGSEVGYYDDSVILKSGTLLDVSVSGSEAVAINVDSMQVYGSTINANAPNGAGGVKVKNRLYIVDEGGKKSYIIANSDHGRALSSENVELYGSEIKAITEGGEMGVHANSYLSISPGIETGEPSYVYGKADIGYGVVAQNIDDGDSEFPSGSIHMDSGKLEGYVNEGMGVSTNMTSIYSENGKPELIGAADKGIGISVCMISASNNAFIKGTSNGASKEHFQVYGSIPDCAGINLLSYLYLQGNVEVIGEAPEEVEGSYGVHCLLPYEGGSASGYVSLYSEDSKPSITATGETGLYAVSVDIYNEGEINATGSKDGIVATTFRTSGNEGSPLFKINAVGGTGAGLKVYNEWEQMYSEFSINNLELNASGGEYGLSVLTDSDVIISDSIIESVSSKSTSSAGGNIIGGQIYNPGVKKITITNSYLNASGGSIGWLFKNSQVALESNSSYLIEKTPQLVGEGEESGILIDFSEEFIGDYQNGGLISLEANISESHLIKGISTEIPPDRVNRKAAISVPSAQIRGGTIEEEYQKNAENPLRAETPYMVYADKMNISDFTAFDWQNDKGGTIKAVVNGLTAEGNGALSAKLTASRSNNVGSKIELANSKHVISLFSDFNIGEVVFNANGGIPAPSSVKVPVGTAFSSPGVINKEGSEFQGWYDNSTGEQWDFENDLMYGEQLVLDARWIAAQYKVTFDPNQGVGSEVEGMPKENPIQTTMGSQITKPQEVPIREGALFEYWALDSKGEKPWNFDTDLTPGKDITLYAIWQYNEFTVTYEALGGNPDKQQEVVKAGEKIPGKITTPSRTGFKFVGWYTDFETTTPWNPEMLMPDSDMILYAKWERINYVVKFDINGGAVENKPEDLAFDFGEQVDISEYQPGGIKAPYYDGHFFIGWIGDDGTPVLEPFEMPQKDVLLKAQWLEIPKENIKDYVVSYRGTKTRDEIEKELAYTFEYVDLSGKLHIHNVLFEWDDTVLTKGGVGTITALIKPSGNGSGVKVRTDISIYVLNYAVIMAEDIQTFYVGEMITVNGSEWGPSCQAEVPDFTTKTIKTVDVALTFHLQGTDIRTPGTYSPMFTGSYSDYFGENIELTRKVTAIILPALGQTSPGGGSTGSGSGSQTGGDKLDTSNNEFVDGNDSRAYWGTVETRLLEPAQFLHYYVTPQNYPFGGQRVDLELKGLRKRVLARPEKYTVMPASTLDAVRVEDNTQLQVDLDWIQWYFNSADFKDSVSLPSGNYALDVKQVSSNKNMMDLIKGRKAMPIEFSMNKSWSSRPTMQVQVSEELNQSSKDGKSLYLFWFNPQADRLELVGRMKDNGEGWFSIRMSSVNKDYVILDEIPIAQNKVPEFVISDKTNPVDEEISKELEDSLNQSDRDLSQIYVGKPQEYNEEEFPMLAFTNVPVMGQYSVVCFIALILLIVVIVLEVIILMRQNKMLNQNDNSNNVGDNNFDNNLNSNVQDNNPPAPKQ